jgi:hypothetical protein
LEWGIADVKNGDTRPRLKKGISNNMNYFTCPCAEILLSEHFG